MKKKPEEDSSYVSERQLRDWSGTTPADRLRFIEESKEFLRKAWDSKMVEIVDKLRRLGL